MPLLIDDPKATDTTYINLQKDLWFLEPPDLARRHVEELYNETSAFLDEKFHEQCKHDFHPCYAEMYFAAVLKVRCGYELSHPSDRGPDFFLPPLDCWAEVVSLTDGAAGNPNSIPRAVSGELYEYPEDQVILRMCSAFKDKAEKIAKDIDKGIIKSNQPIVLCISGGRLEERLPMYHVGGYPQIVKALLPIGELTFWLSRETGKFISRKYKYREGITKTTQKSECMISTETFLNDSNAHISAVMYSWTNAGNPISREHWGSDIYTVHNPKAKNPLPLGFAKCGIEYPVSEKPDFFTMEPLIDHEQR